MLIKLTRLLLFFPAIKILAMEQRPCEIEVRHWAQVEGRQTFVQESGRHWMEGKALFRILKDIPISAFQERVKEGDPPNTVSLEFKKRSEPSVVCELVLFKNENEKPLTASEKFTSLVITDANATEVQIFPYKNQAPTKPPFRQIHSLKCRDIHGDLIPSPEEVNFVLAPFAAVCSR